MDRPVVLTKRLAPEVPPRALPPKTSLTFAHDLVEDFERGLAYKGASPRETLVSRIADELDRVARAR